MLWILSLSSVKTYVTSTAFNYTGVCDKINNYVCACSPIGARKPAYTNVVTDSSDCTNKMVLLYSVYEIYNLSKNMLQVFNLQSV